MTLSPEILIPIIDKVKRGILSIRKASLEYKIPFSTLQSYTSGRRKYENVTGGRRPVLALDEERRLADYLKTLEKWGFGLSRNEVMDCVQEYVTQNNIKNSFKDNRPGEDWFLGFKRRNRLSIKKPQALEYSRKKMTDPFVIQDYFDLLYQQLTELNLFEKPSHIWNLDETSVCTDPSKTKVVGEKGKSCSRTIGGSGKENITCLVAVNAAGGKAPPLVIFKGKNVWSSWVPEEDDLYSNMSFAASTNGWITSDIFYNYLEKSLIPEMKNERPVLLIYDGHSTHVTSRVVELAQLHNINILKLPPHTSHLLQPLDLAVFKSLKDKWDQKLCNWQRKHNGMRIPKKNFATLLARTWVELNPEIIANGFHKAGIVPFNRWVIPKEKFDTDSWKRWKELHKSNDVVSGTEENEINDSSQSNVSFEQILLNTMRNERQTNAVKTRERKRVAQGAEVITASQVQKRHQALVEQSKKPRNKKGQKKLPTVRLESDSSESFSEPEYIDSNDDLDPEDFSETESCNNEEVTEKHMRDTLEKTSTEDEGKTQHDEFLKHPSVGDYIVVMFSGQKNIKKPYVGKVTEILEDKLFYCSFLRDIESSKYGRYYVFPDVEDKSVVSENEIEQILQRPNEKRGRMYFQSYHL